MKRTAHCLSWSHLCSGVCALLLLSLVSTGCKRPSAEQKVVDDAIERLSRTMGSDFDAIHEIHGVVRTVPEDKSLPRLAYWLTSHTNTKRRSAIHIIQHLRWEDPTPVLSGLRSLLKHSEGKTRGMAAAALAALGDGESRDTIVAQLADGDPHVRTLAAWSVGEFGDPVLLEALRPLLGDSDNNVQRVAQNAVDRLEYLKSESDAPESQRPAIRALWALAGAYPGDTDRFSHAMAAMEAVSEEHRDAAIKRALANPSVSIQNAAKIANGTISIPS